MKFHLRPATGEVGVEIGGKFMWRFFVCLWIWVKVEWNSMRNNNRASHEEHLLNGSRYSLVIKCMKWIKYANGAFRCSLKFLMNIFLVLANPERFQSRKFMSFSSSISFTCLEQNFVLVYKNSGKATLNISSWQYFNSLRFLLHFLLL